MKQKSIAIVGAAETSRLGVIPDMSQIQLHADAALNAMADAGLKPADIDGIALSAASACNWICDMSGMTPSCVVSAAPTMAIDFGFIFSPPRRAEEGEGDLVVEPLEGNFDRHVEQ